MSGGWTPRRSRALLAVVLIAAGSATAFAMRRTATTFDEIVMITGGVRGWATGAWDLAPEHPPITQYLYGALARLTDPTLPPESLLTRDRYSWARTFFWGSGNDPELLAFLGRLPAVACVMVLIGAVWALTRRYHGDAAALLAATMVAFTPDVLAHGGVAYNDVPVALAVFLAVWAMDRAVREPRLVSGVVAGCAVGLALGTKNSAVALAPIALLLVIAELVSRRGDSAWRRGLMLATVAGAAAVYGTLVVVYRGDVLLGEYRTALEFVVDQVTESGAPAYMLGRTSATGWWYYFPVAFLFKTSAGFHFLLVLALGSFLVAMRQPGALRRIAASRKRGPAIAVVVFGVLLLRSRLNIGFRYALPVLPMLAVITAVGTVHAWRSSRARMRGVIACAIALLVLHPLSYYPNFLAYISEYGPGRERNYEVLVDSSLDWGQGLLQLRDYMEGHDIPSVWLSYYGSAVPEGYGIAYIPLLTPFPGAAPPPLSGPDPEYVVISATNLAGGSLFADRDPYASFREREPDFVVAYTLFGFRLAQ
jgi:hypothetical protein